MCLLGKIALQEIAPCKNRQAKNFILAGIRRDQTLARLDSHPPTPVALLCEASPYVGDPIPNDKQIELKIILRILITSTLLKMDTINGSSHDLVAGSMSSDTFVRTVLPRGVIIFLEQSVGIQQYINVRTVPNSPYMTSLLFITGIHKQLCSFFSLKIFSLPDLVIPLFLNIWKLYL
jgi:hypothetical protein